MYCMCGVCGCNHSFANLYLCMHLFSYFLECLAATKEFFFAEMSSRPTLLCINFTFSLCSLFYDQACSLFRSTSADPLISGYIYLFNCASPWRGNHKVSDKTTSWQLGEIFLSCQRTKQGLCLLF